MLHRVPPLHPRALLAIPSEPAQLVPLVHDLHTLGLPAGAITVFGRPDQPALAAALVGEGDDVPRQPARTPEALAAILEPTNRFEVFGASVGLLAGLLGGMVALALPGSGLLWFTGGAALLLAEETAAALIGLGLGGVLGTWLGWEIELQHADLFEQALAEGRSVVLVQGNADELRVAEARLRGYALVHLDRI
jgi:hypothetical protein